MKRHPQLVAIDKWFESPEGERTLNPHFLRHSNDVLYLKNRLISAFHAGWKASEDNAQTQKERET